MPVREELVDAALVLASNGLVDAFGHVSARTPEGTILITPPSPLGTVAADAELIEFPVAGDDLPAGVPREAWIHRATYRRRTDVGAICRAQPPAVAGAVGGGLTIRALHGQGAFVGSEVPLYDTAQLVRERGSAEALAGCLGDGWAVIMRGNGAVTAGADVGAAAGRMYVLEASARINIMAAASGVQTPLTPADVEAWQDVATEILGRMWAHLRQAARRGL